MSKLVLILNCGSSSLKFAILDPATGEEKLSGLAEAFYLPEARIKWKINGEKGSADLGAGAAHTEALNFIASNIMTDELKNSITSIGHRIVHGGECIQPLNMRNIKTNRDWAGIFGNKWDEYR